MFITNTKILRAKNNLDSMFARQLRNTLSAQAEAKTKAENDAKAEQLASQLKEITPVHE